MYNVNYTQTGIIGICIYLNISMYHNIRMSFFTVGTSASSEKIWDD